jgi:hypothetical protein
MLSDRTNINNRFARNYTNGKMGRDRKIKGMGKWDRTEKLPERKDGSRIIKKAPIRYSFQPAIEAICGVDDGVRTHDPQNHNLML